MQHRGLPCWRVSESAIVPKFALHLYCSPKKPHPCHQQPPHHSPSPGPLPLSSTHALLIPYSSTSPPSLGISPACIAWTVTLASVTRTDRRLVHPRTAKRPQSSLADTNLQRTHADMQDEGSSSPTWPSLHRLSASRERNDGSPSRPNVSGLHLPQITTMAPSQQPRRYPGDGLDLRRPVSSLSRNNSDTAVIDLTADDSGPSASNNRPSISAHPAPPRPPNRLPRFAREIIDIDEEDTPRSAPDSPEIEFISSRRIDPPRESPVRRNIDEDDLEILGSNIVPGHRMWGVGAMMAMADVLRDEPERPVRCPMPNVVFQHPSRSIKAALESYLSSA